MNRFRLSIRGVMVLVVMLAIALAALHFPTPFWANVWFSLPLGMLTLAIPAAIYGRGQRRAFWVGFACCGWTYFVAAMAPWFQTETSFQLVTTTILDLMAPYIVERENLIRTYIGGFNPPSDPIRPTPWQLWNLPVLAGERVWRTGYVSLHGPVLYFRIGHGVCCLVIAFLGGEAVRYLAAVRSQTETAQR